MLIFTGFVIILGKLLENDNENKDSNVLKNVIECKGKNEPLKSHLKKSNTPMLCTKLL